MMVCSCQTSTNWGNLFINYDQDAACCLTAAEDVHDLHFLNWVGKKAWFGRKKSTVTKQRKQFKNWCNPLGENLAMFSVFNQLINPIFWPISQVWKIFSHYRLSWGWLNGRIHQFQSIMRCINTSTEGFLTVMPVDWRRGEVKSGSTPRREQGQGIEIPGMIYHRIIYAPINIYALWMYVLVYDYKLFNGRLLNFITLSSCHVGSCQRAGEKKVQPLHGPEARLVGLGFIRSEKIL